MTINVVGLSSSRKTPGIYLRTVFGGAGASAGSAPKKILLVGNALGSALSGAAPSFSVDAGTMAAAEPIFSASPDDTRVHAGRGSELHRMHAAVAAQYPDATVYLLAVAESTGTKASATLTFVGTASGAVTLRLVICGKPIDVAVANSDTATTIATAAANAILDEPDLPVTAQYALGVLTITAKHPGPRGNDLVVDAYWVSSTSVETRITTVPVSSGVTTTGQFAGVTTVESTYKLAGGTMADDVTNALAAVVGTKFDRYVLAHRDTTNVGLVTSQLDTMAGVTVQLRQQAVVCIGDTYATAVTFATGRNKERLQCVWHYNSETPLEEVAAQVCAARLIGDAQAGGNIVGEATDPAANLDGLRLKTVRRQRFAGERPTPTEIENALNNGLTPLAGTDDGLTTVVRSITTRCLASGQPNYSVMDTSVVTVGDHVADDLRADLAAVYAGFKLAADTADGSPPKAANVTTPSLVKSRIGFKLRQYEEQGILTGVEAHLPLLAVTSPSASRLDAEIPFEPMPGLHVIGGNVRQVAA
jgi:phage tail sheath gpL-like